MTTDSDSYDIELAVDKLSDRLFGERKGNLFLSVIGCCKRILYSSDVKVFLVSQCVHFQNDSSSYFLGSYNCIIIVVFVDYERKFSSLL